MSVMHLVVQNWTFIPLRWPGNRPLCKIIAWFMDTGKSGDKPYNVTISVNPTGWMYMSFICAQSRHYWYVSCWWWVPQKNIFGAHRGTNRSSPAHEKRFSSTLFCALLMLIVCPVGGHQAVSYLEHLFVMIPTIYAHFSSRALTRASLFNIKGLSDALLLPH